MNITSPESSFRKARLVLGLALSATGLGVAAQTYVQEAKLLASDGVANQRAGMALAVYGNTAVIGAPLSNVGGRIAEGAAYVYVRNGTTWSFQAKLTEWDGNTDNNEADHFGAAVAIFGETIAVGAPQNPAAMPPQSGFANRGAVYVFKLEGGTWTFKQKVASMDATLGDLFGSAVALSADALLVGAPFAPTPSATHPDTGAAYVYDGAPGAMNQRAKLIPPTGAAYDQFGAAVALAGNVALIGAAGTDAPMKADRGAAYVFERSSPISWPLTGQLAASDGAAYDKFGSAIAATTDRLIVGAPNAAVGGKINQGSAYVFARNSTGGWAEDGKLVATDGSTQDSLGTSVTFWGDRAVAGAPLADPGTTDLGAVYVFAKGTGWAQEAKLVVTGGATSDQVGRVMTGSSNLLLTSGVTAAIGANAAQGAAYVFRIPSSRGDRELPTRPLITQPPQGPSRQR